MATTNAALSAISDYWNLRAEHGERSLFQNVTAR